MRTSIKTTIAAAAIAAVMAGTAALADAPQDSRVTIRVPYGDLDLTREDGLATLHARVRAAAQRVCRNHDLRDVEQRAEWKVCYETAISDALAQIEIPQRAARR